MDGYLLLEMAPRFFFLLLYLGFPLNAAQTPLELRDLVTTKTISVPVSIPLVLVFLSANCPCSRSHEPVLRNLAGEFPEFRFFGVLSNQGESRENARRHFKGLPFSVVDDASGVLANQYGALKTPHVFVLDKSNRVVYSGGVDDSHDATRATRHLLKEVLSDLRAGRAPRVREARALGCPIR